LATTPDCRKIRDFTGGLNPFAGWGLVSKSRLERDNPQYGQRLPELGARMKSGTGSVSGSGGIQGWRVCAFAMR
jgi:hypothetical protein